MEKILFFLLRLGAGVNLLCIVILVVLIITNYKRFWKKTFDLFIASGVISIILLVVLAIMRACQ